MVTMAKRIEELREKKGMSRIELCNALGFPKMQIEKFETGRLTPSKVQQQKMAQYFGVSVEYLSGVSDDDKTLAQWLNDDGPRVVIKRPAEQPKPKPSAQIGGNEVNIFASLLKSEEFKQAVIEVLKTPEGKELIRKAAGK